MSLLLYIIYDELDRQSNELPHWAILAREGMTLNCAAVSFFNPPNQVQRPYLSHRPACMYSLPSFPLIFLPFQKKRRRGRPMNGKGSSLGRLYMQAHDVS